MNPINPTYPEQTWTEIETSDPAAFRTKMNQFIELRSQGLSLRKIAEQIGVPKSTLCDWHTRNRAVLASKRRIELEALEEHLLGSHEQQIAALAGTLKLLEESFAERLQDYKYELSATELFWMAANLRGHIQRVSLRAKLSDSTEAPQ
jgi:hypothetical protein